MSKFFKIYRIVSKILHILLKIHVHCTSKRNLFDLNNYALVMSYFQLLTKWYIFCAVKPSNFDRDVN